jgi:hypothetical protein
MLKCTAKPILSKFNEPLHIGEDRAAQKKHELTVVRQSSGKCGAKLMMTRPSVRTSLLTNTQ